MGCLCSVLCVFLVDCLGVCFTEGKEGSCFLLDLSECILLLPIQNSSQPSPPNFCLGTGGGIKAESGNSDGKKCSSRKNKLF